MARIKYWNRLSHQIERGKKGLNTGIPFYGFTTLSDQIMNIQQGRYDLIFAGTSVGKTAFVNSTYVFGAIELIKLKWKRFKISISISKLILVQNLYLEI